MEVVAGVAVTMVCADGAGAGFVVGVFEPAPGISDRAGGPAAWLKSGSGKGVCNPRAMGTTAVMCVSGPYTFNPRPSLSLAALTLRSPSM
mmetsp:Transcript_94997/g.290586  ORF Transcript_94997/g.290586 Transcript_94997/m.290586 type:complete len:90 (+) Transcript_94997:469-738(+)